MNFRELAAGLAGKFLVLDGPDGAGKSTQLNRLASRLRDAGAPLTLCRDPGGTVIGDRIRSLLLDHDLSEMQVNCETFLFMASRAQLVGEIIRPALAAGSTVLCDRFISSTCAYQGAAGYDPQRVIDLARFAIEDCWPDATLVLDVEVEEGFQRIARSPEHALKHRQRQLEGGADFDDRGLDAMEARPLDFHRNVRQLFLDLHRYYPTPVVMVDGRCDPDTVHQRVLDALAARTW